MEVVAESTACFKFLNNLGAAFLTTTQCNFFTTGLTILLRHKLEEKLPCSRAFFAGNKYLPRFWLVYFALFPWVFPLFFCWHQVLTSSFEWFIFTCSCKFFLFFCWQQVLVSSFDLLILLSSMTLVIGPDVRRWPEYETLLRKTPPKLNTSSNVFVGTNSCEQVVWIYF